MLSVFYRKTIRTVSSLDGTIAKEKPYLVSIKIQIHHETRTKPLLLDTFYEVRMGGHECANYKNPFVHSWQTEPFVTQKTIWMKNQVEIHYCTQCRWLLRAAWMGQELLTTFEQELHELTLHPGTGGIFEIKANGILIWSRKDKGRFPEITELKQLVRDQIAPDKSLGHSDGKKREH